MKQPVKKQQQQQQPQIFFKPIYYSTRKKLIPSNPNGFDQPHLSEIVLKTSQLIKKQQQQQIPHSCKF